ncbi:TetR/AcrR family transcriptional regulator [Pleionea sp. CnH1-48]|uniref:TetR/AcrR family transcriptional regulator n=1 Tax=Pleionea sp. CnH1-48 TaxID=2954494 RepID=UPI002097D66F|nr:TetR/AcrR family transcriptional regulator [Pleionea sp. CnH1-48]MCO7223039.1 TetR/AcrR family transcriptional regulator [Pleionea sp. CnH1-48]
MTVKSPKRGRPAKHQTQLSKEAIVSSAKLLMKKEGAIPSIRKLATELNVDAMAIYHYFANKNQLLESITTSLISDIYQPKPSEDWKTELHQLCVGYLNLLNQYPGLLQILLSMESNSPAMIFIERYESIISDLPLSSDNRKHALDLLVDYIHGFALAMSCDKQSLLNIEAFDGPFEFFCKAIEGYGTK